MKCWEAASLIRRGCTGTPIRECEQAAHADLQRRVADQLRELSDPDGGCSAFKQVDELVQELCLLADFEEPDSHCVVHDDDRDNYADGEWGDESSP